MLAQGALVVGGLIAALLLVRQRPPSIKRIGVTTTGPFAQAVVHGDVVYLSGVTAKADGQPISEKDSVEEQTRRVLKVIDERLALARTDKSRLIQAQVWLKDIEKDFKGMNAAWNEWVGPVHKPTRATVESKLAMPAMFVEIQVTAVLK
jgi:enamine deaminase RidA (YjgF/YER057c/UK114 family)